MRQESRGFKGRWVASLTVINTPWSNSHCAAVHSGRSEDPGGVLRRRSANFEKIGEIKWPE
jgi:hypothetical protein